MTMETTQSSQRYFLTMKINQSRTQLVTISMRKERKLTIVCRSTAILLLWIDPCKGRYKREIKMICRSNTLMMVPKCKGMFLFRDQSTLTIKEMTFLFKVLSTMWINQDNIQWCIPKKEYRKLWTSMTVQYNLRFNTTNGMAKILSMPNNGMAKILLISNKSPFKSHKMISNIINLTKPSNNRTKMMIHCLKMLVKIIFFTSMKICKKIKTMEYKFYLKK